MTDNAERTMRAEACKSILTALAILSDFDAAVDWMLDLAVRGNIVDEATARIEKAQGTDRRSAAIAQGDRVMDERSTQARSSPRSINL